MTIVVFLRTTVKFDCLFEHFFGCWSRSETARASFQAGVGHVMSTLLIAVVVWLAGVAFATRFGNIVDTATSIALIGFGGWIALGALREMHDAGRHSHVHIHGHGHDCSASGTAEEACPPRPRGLLIPVTVADRV